MTVEIETIGREIPRDQPNGGGVGQKGWRRMTPDVEVWVDHNFNAVVQDGPDGMWQSWQMRKGKLHLLGAFREREEAQRLAELE